MMDHYCFAFVARLWPLLSSEPRTIASIAYELSPQTHPHNEYLKSDVGFHLKQMWRAGLLKRDEGYRLKYSIVAGASLRDYMRRNSRLHEGIYPIRAMGVFSFWPDGEFATFREILDHEKAVRAVKEYYAKNNIEMPA